MSKGSNIFNHFTPRKLDGHKIYLNRKMVHCPEINDTISFNFTSAGIECNHCKKII